MIRVLTIQDKDEYWKKKIKELQRQQELNRPTPPPPEAA
jgi:hypothetical protein